MNENNEQAIQYLRSIYPKARDRVQIGDLFERLIVLPDKLITPADFLGFVQRIEAAEYTDNFFEVMEKLAQAVKYHNDNFKKPSKEFNYVDDLIYLDRDDILEICQYVLNARDKALILGAFEGLHGAHECEILDITEKDITDDGVYIKSRDEVFPASGQLIQYLKEASMAKDYLLNTKGRRHDSVPLKDDGTMLKKQSRVDSSAAEARLISQNLVRIGTLLGFAGPITFRHIRTCGRKYYLEKACEEFKEEDYHKALKANLKLRKKYMSRFGLNTYSSLERLMEPIDKLIARPR